MSAFSTDADDTRKHYVYRLYNDDRDLVYIGCTHDVDYRLTLHHATRGVTMCETEAYPDKVTARAAERAAIAAEAPLLNKQHNPKRFAGRAGGGFVPVEPVHPLTQRMLDNERPATLDEMREALEKVADLLGLGMPKGEVA